MYRSIFRVPIRYCAWCSRTVVPISDQLKRHSYTFQTRLFLQSASCFTQVRKTVESSSPEPEDGEEAENHFRRYLHELVLTRDMTIEDWSNIKDRCIQSFKHVNDRNFHGIMVRHLATSKQYELLESYLQYMKSVGGKVSPFMMSFYLRLAAELDKWTEDTIIDRFNDLNRRLPVMDSVISENLIYSICRTRHWKESLAIVKKHQGLLKPTVASCGFIASAAFRNHDYQVAWKCLGDVVDAFHHIPATEVYNQCLRTASELVSVDLKQSIRLVEKLLEFLKEKEIVVEWTVAEGIKDFYMKLEDPRWKSSFVKINRDGKCPACNGILKMEIITEDDFQQLQKETFNRVLKQTDIFLNTTPKELEMYKSFLEIAKPFDVVIDALNVAFAGKEASNKVKANRVLKIVKHYVSQHKQVLVIGRKHMLQWPKEPMTQIKRLTKCFFANDGSKDDPFLLYAAMVGGPSTVIVSRDLMRDHLFKLNNPELGSIFKRWQRTHQVVVNTGDLELQEPIEYQTTVQGSSMDGWHVPYDDGIELEPHGIRKTWLCLLRNNGNS